MNLIFPLLCNYIAILYGQMFGDTPAHIQCTFGLGLLFLVRFQKGEHNKRALQGAASVGRTVGNGWKVE